MISHGEPCGPILLLSMINCDQVCQLSFRVLHFGDKIASSRSFEIPKNIQIRLYNYTKIASSSRSFERTQNIQIRQCSSRFLTLGISFVLGPSFHNERNLKRYKFGTRGNRIIPDFGSPPGPPINRLLRSALSGVSGVSRHILRVAVTCHSSLSVLPTHASHATRCAPRDFRT